MKSIDVEKLCESCRYYRAYYYKRDAGLRYANAGHCLQRSMTMRERRIVPFISKCEFWEPKEIQIQERRESIEEEIHMIRKRLSNILLILKDDAE